jgi:hypothetical protein
MREVERTTGETLKTPERVAKDTKKVRVVRIGIALAVTSVIVIVALVLLQFAFSQLG